MKKIIPSLLMLILSAQCTIAQTNKIRPKSLSISAIANDFATPLRIRNSSLSNVLRDKQGTKLKNMDLGFAIGYIQGLGANIDFATTIGGSFTTISLPNKTFTQDHFLIEADASANFKMFSEAATVNPYLIAGVGVSKYTNIYGAFIPLGGGVKLNLFDETQLSLQLQYRVPVTTEANNYHFQVSFGVSGLL